uniref:Uncharacterized protein n=1 Tax=Physcomitrium patens TaxID=3218 RepID=A0A2K1K8J5_PHYPA|nr:hypothetical protein PHYPA_011993 [Physcomitrium patens]
MEENEAQFKVLKNESDRQADEREGVKRINIDLIINHIGVINHVSPSSRFREYELPLAQHVENLELGESFACVEN